MALQRVFRGLLFALALSLVAALAPVPNPVVAAEPAGFGYFHTYAETNAVINAAVTQHPKIAAKFSLGQSHQGRAIRAVRLTANVAGGNHGRPEVFINGLMHARERASGELAIYMIKVLTKNYGRDTTLGRRVTAILNSTVVYIAPMMNPDGAEFDFKGGRFHSWRKNRQPIPNSSAVGVDLNRQFGYTWGCCGGSSIKPSSDFYRGPEAWFAPEVRAYRNFINDRSNRMAGILSLHSAGRLVLWPYAYTKQDVPHDMDPDDHPRMVALGRGMAQRNGYRAEQGSDLYIVDGDQDDWAYGQHGIYAFTIEMARGSAKRYYPSRSELNNDLNRNRKAILWFLEQMSAGKGAVPAAGTGSTVAPDAAEPSPEPTDAISRYKQSVYNSAVVQPQKTNCWCVVAGTRAWLRHLDPTLTYKQSVLNEFMTLNDKNDWTDPSTSYYMRCRRGWPRPSFAHDGRGMAWTLWNYRPADLPYGFNDYFTTGAKAMNWQFVRNIRATRAPVGAVVASGQHMILVVGYKTKLDPFAEKGQLNSLYGFRVWDPWYQAGFGNWSGWPAGGFAGNSYVTIGDWNRKYFRKDVNEGPYYYGKFVGVLPTSTLEAPSDTPPRSYGQVAYESANNAVPAASEGFATAASDALAPAEPSEAQAAAPSRTVAAAIESGLREHGLLNDPELGNLPASYTVGTSVAVDSLAVELPSYLLVELRVGSRVRAVATVNRTPGGYVFGELRATKGDLRLPTTTELRSRAAAHGLNRDVRLVWGWTDERVPQYAPFLAGTSRTTGRTTFVTPAGVSDRFELAAGLTPRLQPLN